MYLLRAFGHEPLEARDGAEGLALLRREKPELALVDIHMPGMDGYEFVRQARAERSCQPVALLAVTALAMTGDREKILAQGFDGYISKPVAPEAVLEQLQKYLGPEPRRPAAVAEPEPQPPAVAEIRSAPARPLILFVDNCETNIQVARSALEPAGYRVVAAHSVSEGIAQARRTRPDLLISDIHMPRQDGFDLLDMTMGDPELSQVPFIILSSSICPDQDRQRALLRGVKRFLSRPIAPEQLLAEVETCLAKRMGA